MKSLSQILILGMAMIVMGCNNYGGDASATAPKQFDFSETQSVADVSQSSHFTPIQIAPALGKAGFEEYFDKRYSESCEIEKADDGRIIKISPKNKFDPALRVDDSVYLAHKKHTSQYAMHFEQKISVRELNENSALMNVKFLSFQLPQAAGEVLTKPMMDDLKCEFQENSEVLCKPTAAKKVEEITEMNQQGIEFFVKLQNKEKDCWLQEESEPKEEKETGTYEFQNEVKVSAYRETFVRTGTVVCDGVEAGPGSLVETSIYSTEVVDVPTGLFIGHCGGAKIFESSVIKSKDQIIQSTRTELLQAQMK